MEPFTTLTAIAAPLMRANIDTDTIIPSREMRSVSRAALAEGLFASWRYAAIGSREPNLEFVLNQKPYDEARIFVGGRNFGCGSSREHAVWALEQYGFRAIIAPSFNPIFRNNCITNGIVPVSLDEDSVAELGAWLETAERPVVTVDLEEGRVTTGDGRCWPFEIEEEARASLLLGLDPMDMTLRLSKTIERFRNADMALRPWVYTPLLRDEAS